MVVQRFVTGFHGRAHLTVFLALVGSLLVPASGEATFPGLNGKIVFHSNRSGQNDVFVKEPRRDAADLNRSDTVGSNDITANWSPDGTKIAFASDRDGDYEIFTMNADGTGQTQRTFNTVDDRNPNWSRDGSRLAFEKRNRPPEDLAPSDIYIVASNGGTAVNCTNDAADDSNPSWSPGEDKIAFSSNRSPVPTEDIWVTSVNGTTCSSPSNLTDWTYSAFNRGPDWSPDGQRIAFYSDRDPDPNVIDGRNEEVWVMNKDGTGQTNLTKYPANPVNCPRDVNACADRSPAWSPDGKLIAFDTSRNWQPSRPYLTEIWVMNADGSNPTLLSEAGDAEPDWQPTFAPAASFGVAPDSALTGQPVSFNSTSSDRFGVVTNHKWDLDGDGSFETDTGTSPTAVRAYATAGTVTASLLVTNSDGNTDLTSRTLTITTRRPAAFLAVTPNPAFAGQRVTFDGSASSDPDGSIVNYSWDLDGNGTFETDTGDRPTAVRAYPRRGRISVRLRVTDNDGATSDPGVTASSVRSLTVLPRLILSQATLRAASTRNGVVVRLFRLSEVPSGARVEVQCKPRKRKPCRRQVIQALRLGARAARTVPLRRLQGHKLRNGTTIEIRITKRDYVGKYIRYRIRRGVFRKLERCIKPGERKPQRRCF